MQLLSGQNVWFTNDGRLTSYWARQASVDIAARSHAPRRVFRMRLIIMHGTILASPYFRLEEAWAGLILLLDDNPAIKAMIDRKSVV